MTAKDNKIKILEDDKKKKKKKNDNKQTKWPKQGSEGLTPKSREWTREHTNESPLKMRQ